MSTEAQKAANMRFCSHDNLLHPPEAGTIYIKQSILLSVKFKQNCKYYFSA